MALALQFHVGKVTRNFNPHKKIATTNEKLFILAQLITSGKVSSPKSKEISPTPVFITFFPGTQDRMLILLLGPRRGSIRGSVLSECFFRRKRYKRRTWAEGQSRKVEGESGSYELREGTAVYEAVSDSQNHGLRLKHTFFGDIYICKSISWKASSRGETNPGSPGVPHHLISPYQRVSASLL